MEIKNIDTARFGKIGVLMGGTSTERDISLKSGHAVLESLKKQGLDAVGIDIKTDDHRLAAEFIKSFGVDCAFVALHGKFGEDGQVQSILEGLRLRYTGSGPAASRNAMDKINAKKIFRDAGLVTPGQMIIEKRSFNPDTAFTPGVETTGERKFGPPWVIKPASNGSSIGLSIIDRQEDVVKAVKAALEFDDRVLIEEYIPGRELTVGILAEEPLCVIEIVTKHRFFDYQAKYEHGLTDYIVPALLDGETAGRARGAALTAHRALGCFGCSRSDMILDKNGRLYLLEVNTIPGLTSTSLLPKAAGYAGIDFDRLCLILLQSAYEKE